MIYDNIKSTIHLNYTILSLKRFVYLKNMHICRKTFQKYIKKNKRTVFIRNIMLYLRFFILTQYNLILDYYNKKNL